MAHPTINITEQPSLDCANSAYNCVKYCFEATDFQTATGTQAQFTIAKDGAIAGYLPGIEFTIAGQVFTTGTVNTYNEVNTAPTQTALQFVQNFQQAFESNQYLFNTFTFAISGGTTLIGKAREVGVIDDFVFDFSNFPSTPPVNSNTQGTDDDYRDNYRLIVEIFEIVDNINFTSMLISKEAYIPDADGDFCINIGEKVACILDYSFFLTSNQAIQGYADFNISKNVFIRYGESYSDTLSECDVQLRHFESSEVISVMNSAFERDEATDKVNYVCEGNFMTNTPQYTELCDTTETMLWIDLTSVIADPPDINVQVRPWIEITYTDGTSSTHLNANLPLNPALSRQIYSVCCGATNVNNFATVGKTIDFYEVRIQRNDTNPGGTIDYFGSQFFKRITCCDGDIVFYFLNEFGGFDSILFSELDSVDFEQDFSTFEQFLDCDDSSFAGGKAMVDVSSRDVYNVTSKFPNTYQSRLWLREFLKSPQKMIKLTVESQEIFSKVIILSASVKYLSNNDDSLLLRLSYILNEDLNTQKN